MLTTARSISSAYPNAIFRAGLWKPRTRPNQFEGVGAGGLEWLAEVKKETGLRVATEVANAGHVQHCLDAGLDIFWIGARTTVNPFYVQEIAVALKDSHAKVFIKNPVSPDLNLWLGAIERIEQSGLTGIIAIHRGFQSYNSSPYRNKPQWEIPIELMSRRPDIPIICDISHICGDPMLFRQTAQKALDLNMAGLHVEVHPDPKSALSDSRQQITVEQLTELIDSLEFRRKSSDDATYLEMLRKLRREIDFADEELISALHRRVDLVRRIAVLKKENQVTILQVERWKEIIEHYLSDGKTAGLEESFLREVLNAIHDESMRVQNEIMNSAK